MTVSTLFGGACLILAVAVYANYRSPAPDVGRVHGRSIEPSSYVLLALVQERGQHHTTRPARRGLIALPRAQRARCWALFRIVVDVFRYAPEHRDSLERVLRAYAIKRTPTPGPGPCTRFRLKR